MDGSWVEMSGAIQVVDTVRADCYEKLPSSLQEEEDVEQIVAAELEASSSSVADSRISYLVVAALMRVVVVLL